jgi:dienelactone hydrolase
MVGALIIALLLVVSPAAAQELTMVPVTVGGETVKLAMRIYKPATPGPAPTLVFHHGSTGRGTEPRIIRMEIDYPPLAKFFVDRGWAVVMPARRGRGGSDGTYDEGYERDRSRGYSCDPALSIPGADRALDDIDAATTAILAMPFVDGSRVVQGGQSRGGILSVAYAGRQPKQMRGVINFVGGWNGSRCPTAASINQSLMSRGGAYPGEVLFLYGEADPFYPMAHSRGNFDAFRAAGGTGLFLEFPAPHDNNGHRISGYPDMWRDKVESYLTRLALPATPR